MYINLINHDASDTRYICFSEISEKPKKGAFPKMRKNLPNKIPWLPIYTFLVNRVFVIIMYTIV